MKKLNGAVLGMAGALWRGALFILLPLGRLLGMVLGRWEPPSWSARAGSRLAPARRFAASNAAWVLLLVLLGAGALATPRLMKIDWHGKFAALKSVKPDQGRVTTSDIAVTNPERSAIEDSGKPHPAVLGFSVSAAPLARVGKEASDIAMEPALAGKRVWAEANRLEFTPAEDWPIDVKYTVTLGAKALAPHIDVDRRVVFNSPRFEFKIREATFYQDPVQFTLRKAVFELAFSHPVDVESPEKRLKLSGDADPPACSPSRARRKS